MRIVNIRQWDEYYVYYILIIVIYMDSIRLLAALGKRIKNLRLERHLTQTQLAKLCKFEKASMSRIESGKTNISMLTLFQISKALEVEIKTLFSD